MTTPDVYCRACGHMHAPLGDDPDIERDPERDPDPTDAELAGLWRRSRADGHDPDCPGCDTCVPF